uniref:Retrotransposable element Tf2 n=1 Tax=Cajanus cajan TaxID=3821 RepID=A0A151T3H0_CAJCA|nr:Retrotransposable element Tf2 [Cajanus cajan]KYP61600.1 Retrotransposable element Tf2 [Cajanus cajan]
MHNNGLLTSWDAFLRALELRFAPSKFDDPIAAICKLTQTQSLHDYLSDFETLANRISDYPQSFYLSCFLSGLKPHLRREVTALQPPDLSHAIALAKLHDDKFRSSPFPPSRFGNPVRSTPPPTHTPISSPVPLKTLPPLLPTPHTKLPIKKLTEAEMQARRDKNLCFNCDEKYTRGHRCKPQFLLLTTFDSDDAGDTAATEELQFSDEDPQEAGLISLHAFSGQWTPQTFRVTGSIRGYAVQILVDSGATHNFIQSRVAQFLHLPSRPTPSPLRVMVGNGEYLPCSSFCPQVSLSLGQQAFSVDLYPLELSGTDIVLGVHWLSMISPFVMDYHGPFMRFMWEDKLIELRGNSESNPSPISANQLRRLHNTNRVEALFQLTLELPSPSITPSSMVTHNPSPTPSSQHQPLQSLIQQYSTLFSTPTRFVARYASIAHPLTDLLKKDNFHWTEQAQQAFDKLKHSLITAPVLAIPKFDLLFIVQTDASGTGKTNNAADALSRLDGSPDSVQPSLLVLSISHSHFSEDLKCSLAANSDFITLRDNISAQPDEFPHFSIRDGLILFKGKIWLPSSCSLIPLILQEFHSTPIAGHTGVSRTLSKLSANFHWDSIRKDVQDFVAKCVICQQTKIPTQRPQGLLQPIPPPSRCWEDLSIDFIVGLPPYKGFTTIMVVVDRYSKGAHFGMLPKSFTAVSVAQLFVDTICKLHGLPHSIISDRDPIFLSHFWQELFRLSGTKLRMSTAYHPQTDGQTEVVNKVLQQYLRCFVHHKPTLWGKFLSWAEWSFNTSVNSSTGFSPFEVAYGYKPPLLPPLIPGDTPNAAVQSELISRIDILRKLESNLKRAQDSMKKWADQSRKDVHFEVGDWVYVRLRPRRQSSVSGTHSIKLMKRFFGPFKILQRIGEVAYEVELPPTARIHNVFHVSLLRPHKGPLPTSPLSLPHTIEENQPVLEPAVLLDWKWDNSSTPPQILVLVHWLGMPLEDATWEIWSILQQQFHLEDKVLFEPGGDVRNTGPITLIEPSSPIAAHNIPPSLIPTDTSPREKSPKRNRQQPHHLKDYIVTCPSSRKKGNSVRGK